MQPVTDVEMVNTNHTENTTKRYSYAVVLWGFLYRSIGAAAHS